ncbi:hypothetical protein M404DRAFT_541812 [Pisolithus tinctorius Marx 270]|uniref:Uncharacterized protein n=1 Tax=Pisolithus tinctorius Marx 270 TaxID=870435 RepID=A0A0C3PAH5_PISTI|nr:hypothetical protein M404DRAFT_541812 [Pisolithus tinctorius Marx 270]
MVAGFRASPWCSGACCFGCQNIFCAGELNARRTNRINFHMAQFTNMWKSECTNAHRHGKDWPVVQGPCPGMSILLISWLDLNI